MNCIIVMSGGVGNRFGSDLPKQYNLLLGKPIIDYVLEACLKSKKADKIVVVMDESYKSYSKILNDGDFDFAGNGKERINSLYNGLSLIHDKYDCDKVLIVDAVAPFLYSELIDDYFDKLDEYDTVITAQKITGGFTDIHDSRLNRDDFIITQSPESFRFKLLWDNFKLDFPFQEMAGLLPDGSKRYYNYNFKNNLKLTYDFELAYAEAMMKELQSEK